MQYAKKTLQKVDEERISQKYLLIYLATRPSLALFLTMQYGTPIFLQSAGRKRTN